MKRSRPAFLCKKLRRYHYPARAECARVGVEIRLQCRVTDIHHGQDFMLQLTRERSDAVACHRHRRPFLSRPRGERSRSCIGNSSASRSSRPGQASCPSVRGTRSEGLQGLAGISLDTAVSCGGKRFRVTCCSPIGPERPSGASSIALLDARRAAPDRPRSRY